MIALGDISRVVGHNVYDSLNKKVGTAEHVYLDEDTGQPEWMTVRTGMFGRQESFVPLSAAELHGDDVWVAFTKDAIKQAPHVDILGDEDFLPADEEARIYQHYRVQPGPTGGAQPPGGQAGQRGDEAAMTRSEERLRVDKVTDETGHARLRKYVTVEDQEVVVPVRREQVRVEREPVSQTDQLRGDDVQIADAEQDVILHEERPVVGTEAVPVERVRMSKETVTDDRTVGGRVRKEHIDTEGIEDPER